MSTTAIVLSTRFRSGDSSSLVIGWEGAYTVTASNQLALATPVEAATNTAMNSGWAYLLGFTLLCTLGVAIGRRLPPEYRSRQTPSLQTVAMVWSFYALHFSLVVLAAVQSTWRFTVPPVLALAGGTFLVVTGAAFYLAAASAFGSLKRMSGLDTARLVTGGIYRWSRNPQTVGWVLFLVGLSLICGSAMILFLAFIFWLSFRLYLPLEEELLRQVFGSAYEAYRDRTHRYFGPPRAVGFDD